MIGGNAEFLTSKDRRPLKNKMEHEMALLLTDKTFVEFYKNNRKDRKFLFDKVAANDLVEFSQKVFSKADVLKCLYVQSYIKKRGITRQKFKDEVLSYIKANKDRKDLKPLENDKDSIRKYSVKYIEDPAVQYIYIDEEDEIVQFESFRPKKSKDLSQIFIYAFKDKGIMRKLKVGRSYTFNAIEAMLIAFIFDENNKEDVKHILNDEEHLISRKFMNTLSRYVYEIVKIRNLDYETERITDIYKKRFAALKSDLPTIIKKLDDIEVEFRKGDAANYHEIVKESKKCISKLEKFNLRCKLIHIESVD